MTSLRIAPPSLSMRQPLSKPLRHGSTRYYGASAVTRTVAFPPVRRSSGFTQKTASKCCTYTTSPAFARQTATPTCSTPSPRRKEWRT
eukprot:2320361-Prymnesium_polylepis.1